MKTLQVISSMLTGGAEKLVVDLLKRFNAKGIVSEVAVLNGVDTPLMQSLTSDGISVHRVNNRPRIPYSPISLRWLNRLIKHGEYDIVHSHNTPAQLAVALCHRPKGTCLVTTEHSTHNRRRNKIAYRVIDRWLYSRYDSIICISEICKEKLISHIGEDINIKVCTIPNGIRYASFFHEFQPIHENQEIIVTMVAGFRPEKDHDTLLRAMALLPEEYRLQLVGDGERRDEILYLARSLGINARVSHLGTRSDISDILSGSDIIVLSTHYEGMSLASLEGMASGRPLIASDVTGVRELVRGHGLLFKHGDALDLSNAILRLANDPVLYRDIVSKCQRQALRFDINATTESYIKHYTQILEQCTKTS